MTNEEEDGLLFKIEDISADASLAECPQKEPAGSRTPICDYIAENYSKYCINKLFRAQMDTTVVDYLITFRMEKAKELLTFTKESVKVIAFRVGYSDPNYFNWTFRKKTGKSPLQFRAEARGKN